MAFRFWRRGRMAPDVTLKLSPSSAALTVGRRGVPGTGIFWTERLDGRRGAALDSTSAGRPEGELEFGFLTRRLASSDARAMLDGLRELARGRHAEAFPHLQRAAHLADAAFAAGFIALKLERYSDADALLAAAVERQRQLGILLTGRGVDLSLELQVAEGLTAHVVPGLRGALLGRVEALQRLRRHDEARIALEHLLTLEPGDAVVRASLAELLLDGAPSPRILRRVAGLAEGVENESGAHAALLLLAARANARRDLHDAARALLGRGLSRTKDRDPRLLRALRVERARCHLALDEPSAARRDLERVLADHSGDREAQRLLAMCRELH